MNEKLRNLGELLRSKRGELNLSSSEVAASLDVSAAYYSRLENGKEKPSRQLIAKLVSFFNLPPEDTRLIETLAGYEVMTHVPTDSQNTVQNQVQIKLDPEKVPVLYSDAMYVTISGNGVVFDFGQTMGPTNEQHIVGRVGVSLEHARRIHKVLGDQIMQFDKNNTGKS